MFLVEDMNASMIDHCGNERDTLLEHFVSENSLNHRQYGIFTYIHSDTSCSSEIDYIFCSNNGVELLSDVNVLSDDINVSDHLPVVVKLNVETSFRIEEQKLIEVKPKWNKCNRQRCKGSIDKKSWSISG